jgi:hypothetical protein
LALVAQDPAYWARSFAAAPGNDTSLLRRDGPLSGDMLAEVMKYADFTEITYNNFIDNQETLDKYRYVSRV